VFTIAVWPILVPITWYSQPMALIVQDSLHLPPAPPWHSSTYLISSSQDLEEGALARGGGPQQQGDAALR
jgi:hypothetical protein